MEKVVGVTKARDLFRRIVDGVQYQGEKYIIERHGKPAIAIVPLSIYEEWKQNRQELFSLIDEFQEASGDNDPDEIMQLVLDAQAATRREPSNTLS